MDQVMDRDARILLYLAKHSFASPRNVEREFFRGIAHRNHYRAIKRLKQRGLVEDIYGDNETLLGFKLSKKGIRITKTVLGPDGSVLTPQGQFRSTYDHDDLLIRLRSVLETSPAISHFCPEQTVRETFAKKYGHSEQEGSGYKVPDATFQLKTRKRNFRVALELELTRKSKRRYRKIIKQLALSRDWDVVFFMLKEASLRKVITDILTELRAKDPEVRLAKFRHGFYFTQLSEVLTHGTSCEFHGEEKSFRISEIENQFQANADKSGDDCVVTLTA